MKLPVRADGRHPCLRWTPGEVAKLRASRERGVTLKELGVLHGVGSNRIGQVLKFSERASKAAAEQELGSLARYVQMPVRWNPELLERAVAAIEARTGGRIE